MLTNGKSLYEKSGNGNKCNSGIKLRIVGLSNEKWDCLDNSGIISL